MLIDFQLSFTTDWKKIKFTTQQCCQPFDAHCCHMSTAIKHPVPHRDKPSFVIFDTQALWRSGHPYGNSGCQRVKCNDRKFCKNRSTTGNMCSLSCALNLQSC